MFFKGYKLLLLLLPSLLIAQNYTIENDKVLIPLSKISLTIQKVTVSDVRFFVGKKSNGTVISHFDECNVCGPAGFTQVGENMRCNSCGQSYKIESLGVFKDDGCWPIYLPSNIEGDNLVIRTADLGITSVHMPSITSGNTKPFSVQIKRSVGHFQLGINTPGSYLLSLFSSDGRCIKTEKIDAGNNHSIVLSTERLTSANYLLVVSGKNGKAVRLFSVW